MQNTNITSTNLVKSRITHSQILTNHERKSIIDLDNAFFPYPWKDTAWDDVGQGNEKYLVGMMYLDQNIIGFSLYLLSPLESLAHLLKILVHPKHRNGGFAIQLLQSDVGELTKMDFKSIYLEVASSNIAATSCYQRFGFVKLHQIKQFYSDGKDADILTLDIDSAH